MLIVKTYPDIFAKERGFTFIEMLVASVIGAGIAIVAWQLFGGVLNIEARVSKVTALTNTINRTWQFLADDIQHAVARPWSDRFNQTQPAMSGALGDPVSQRLDTAPHGDGYLLLFVRSGGKNFFHQPRSNLQLVGYRITREENESQETRLRREEGNAGNIQLWRDYWRPVDSTEEDNIKSRLLLENIKSIGFRYLPHDIDRVTEEAWVNGWPESISQSSQLPIAIEVTIDIAGFGEVSRLFPVVDSLASE